MAIQICNPHDVIFKKFFSDIDVVTEFIECYLPLQLKRHCDFSTLKIEPGSFIDEDLRQQHADILYSLKIGGIQSYVYIHVEHQSTPDDLMAFRMLRYQLAIMKQHLDQGNQRLPAVIPMLFYHGEKSPYPYSLELVDCFEDKNFAEAHFFKAPYLVDITVIPDQEIYQRKKLGLLEIVQKHIFTRDLDSIAKDIVRFMRSIVVEHELFKGLLYYTLTQGDTPDVNRVIETLQTIENYREDVMNAAQQLKQQGLEQGLQQGLQQGRKAENWAIAKRMLGMGANRDFIKKATGLSDKDLLRVGDETL